MLLTILNIFIQICIRFASLIVLKDRVLEFSFVQLEFSIQFIFKSLRKVVPAENIIEPIENGLPLPGPKMFGNNFVVQIVNYSFFNRNFIYFIHQ